jgi:hypothetical protein
MSCFSTLTLTRPRSRFLEDASGSSRGASDVNAPRDCDFVQAGRPTSKSVCQAENLSSLREPSSKWGRAYRADQRTRQSR